MTEAMPFLNNITFDPRPFAAGVFICRKLR